MMNKLVENIEALSNVGLKEKIEALRHPEIIDKYYDFAQGYNQAIDDVIDVIQADFAIINEPKTEGAYLHLENSKWIAKQVRMMDNVGLFYDNRESPSGSVFIHKIKGGLVEPDGQWISLSAIVPKGDNDEQAC